MKLCSIRMLGFTNLLATSIVDRRCDYVLSMELDEVKTKIVIGDPKEKICEAVEELNADLLVMGCRSFGPIKR
ncbi:universal stress protein A-like protein isoform X1, partial [Tanacetum coccineum]